MSDVNVKEEEIEEAELLSAQRKFDLSLVLLREMLSRARNDQTRMRILFDIVTCSTWLDLNEVPDKAIQELKQYPDYEVSHAFIVMVQTEAFIEFGRAQEALDLITEGLRLKLLQREDFQDWKYEYLHLEGRSLTRLARCEEALNAFNNAHAMDPAGKHEIDMLIARSNCLLALSRYEEAYDTARQVLTRGDDEMATLAMQYMAECRMWQSRIPEALELYTAIQKRLPCSLVQEERIETGTKNAMAYLEKNSPKF